MGGSFHGYVSHNQMVGDMILNWTVGTFLFFLEVTSVANSSCRNFFWQAGDRRKPRSQRWCFCNGSRIVEKSGALEDFYEFLKELGMSSSQVTPSFFRRVGRSTTSNGNRLSPESWQFLMFWGLRGGSAVQEPLITYGVHNVIWRVDGSPGSQM